MEARASASQLGPLCGGSNQATVNCWIGAAAADLGWRRSESGGRRAVGEMRVVCGLVVAVRREAKGGWWCCEIGAAAADLGRGKCGGGVAGVAKGKVRWCGARTERERGGDGSGEGKEAVVWCGGW